MTRDRQTTLAMALMFCMGVLAPWVYVVAEPVNVLAYGDSYIVRERPDLNRGTLPTIRTIHKTNEGNEEREHAVISFDLQAFTAANDVKQLDRVVLQLGNATSSASGQTHVVYRLKRDFVEEEVTWNEYAAGNAWQTPGALGADDAVLIAKDVSAGSRDNAWAYGGLDVTDLVNAWLGNPDTQRLNFMIFSPEGAINQIRAYGSRESTNGPGPGPVLAVTVAKP